TEFNFDARIALTEDLAQERNISIMWFETWPFLVIWMTGWLLSLLFSRASLTKQWCVARWTSRAALVSALIIATHALIKVALGWGAVNTDWLGIIVTVLVALLGWVVIKFAEHYLAGEPRQPRFIKATLFTLSAVALILV